MDKPLMRVVPAKFESSDNLMVVFYSIILGREGTTGLRVVPAKLTFWDTGRERTANPLRERVVPAKFETLRQPCDLTGLRCTVQYREKDGLLAWAGSILLGRGGRVYVVMTLCLVRFLISRIISHISTSVSVRKCDILFAPQTTIGLILPFQIHIPL